MNKKKSTIEQTTDHSSYPNRSIMKYICHQIPERCFSINGKPMAICSRCFGFYLGFFIGLILPLFIFIIYEIDVIIILILMVIGILPLALDGGTQFIGWRQSNNSLRFITGIIAGVTLGILFNWLIIHVLFID